MKKAPSRHARLLASLLRQASRLDHLPVPERHHTLHLPDDWGRGPAYFHATVHHAGHFFALRIDEQDNPKDSSITRISILLRQLPKMRSKSGNNPHLSTTSNNIINGIIHAKPKLSPPALHRLAPKLRRLGLSLTNRSIIIIGPASDNHLLDHLLDLCHAVASVKSSP